MIFGFPVPAFLNRGRFLIGAPVPMVVCSKRRLVVRILFSGILILINWDLVYQSPPRGGSTAMCVVARYIRAVNFPR